MSGIKFSRNFSMQILATIRMYNIENENDKHGIDFKTFSLEYYAETSGTF